MSDLGLRTELCIFKVLCARVSYAVDLGYASFLDDNEEYIDYDMDDEEESNEINKLSQTYLGVSSATVIDIAEYDIFKIVALCNQYFADTLIDREDCCETLSCRAPDTELATLEQHRAYLFYIELLEGVALEHFTENYPNFVSAVFRECRLMHDLSVAVLLDITFTK